MLAADAANPAVEAPLALCADGKEGSSSESSDGAPGGGSSSSGDDYDNTGGSSPIAARAAALARSPRPAVVDRHESVSLLALSRLPSWRSWGGVDGVGGSIAEEEGSGVGKPAAERGPSYHCQICLDDRPPEAGFLLSACGHTFCRACLKAYVTSKVNDAEVYPACFHVTEGFDSVGGGGDGRPGRDGGDDADADAAAADDDEAAEAAEDGRARVTRGPELGRGAPGRGANADARGEGDGRTQKKKSCGVVLSPSDIKALLKTDAATSRKYARFLFFREHKTARECPKCGKLSVGDPSRSWEMRCGGCGAVFCYEHGGAHEGKSCAEYAESTADETHRTMALIGRMTKPCPGCGTPVEKLGGCNQMVCLHCNCSFCWLCMEQVDRGTFPVHFQWWNVRGCPNQQLQEGDAHQSTGGRRCLQALSVLQILVVGPFALVLTVASSLACVCCLPAFKLSPRQLFTGCISGWGNFVMVLPLIPLVCASAVVAGVVYIIMLPVRLSTALRRKWRFGRSGLSLHGPGRPGESRARSSGGGASSSSSGGGARGSSRQGAASAGGTASSPENGTIGAADVDVEARNRAPPPASSAAVVAPAAALAEFLGARQERGAAALPSAMSPGSHPVAPPPRLAPSSGLAGMARPLGKSGSVSERSGSSGGGGDVDGHLAAPFASLGVRHMLGRWVGAASPSPSPAAAAGAAVSGARGARAATETTGPPPRRHRRSKKGPADGEEGAICGQVSGYPTAEGVGAAFISSVFSPLSLPGDKEAPRPLAGAAAAAAAAANGPVRDGGGDGIV